MRGHWGATMWTGVHHVSHAVRLPTNERSTTGSLLLRCKSILCTFQPLAPALISFNMSNLVKSAKKKFKKLGSTIKKGFSRPSSPDPSGPERPLEIASTTRASTTPHPGDIGASPSTSPQDHHASSAQPDTSQVLTLPDEPNNVINGPQSSHVETAVSSLRC